MSNINDVIDYLDNLSVESINETIAKFKGDIEKTSSRIAALETLKRAKLMEIEGPEEEDIELKVQEHQKSPWAKPHINGRPAPARSPERSERMED